MKRIARSAIVERSAQELYALVEDIESYPEFLTWCAGTTVHERSAERTVASMKIGVKGLKIYFTTENRNVPGRSIDMQLVEGPFKRFAAAWRFTALAPTAAKIEFSVEYEFANRVIAKALEPAFNRIAEDMVEAFTRRAAVRGRG